MKGAIEKEYHCKKISRTSALEWPKAVGTWAKKGLLPLLPLMALACALAWFNFSAVGKHTSSKIQGSVAAIFEYGYNTELATFLQEIGKVLTTATEHSHHHPQQLPHHYPASALSQQQLPPPVRTMIMQLQSENATLRELLELPKKGLRDLPGITITNAQLIGRRYEAMGAVIFLNAGREKGVKPDDLVLSPSGLVGRITRAEDGYSVAVTIANAAFSVAVLLQDSGIHCIARGQNNQHMPFRTQLRLNHCFKDGKGIEARGFAAALQHSAGTGAETGNIDAVLSEEETGSAEAVSGSGGSGSRGGEWLAVTSGHGNNSIHGLVVGLVRTSQVLYPMVDLDALRYVAIVSPAPLALETTAPSEFTR